MSLFGSKKQQQNNLESSQQKAEMEKRVKCQEEINEILKKYNLAIRARFELVIPPEPVEPPTNKE